MKDYRFFLAIAAILTITISCENIKRPLDLVRFVQNPENGLHKEKIVGPFTVDLQFKPLSYVISNEFRKNEISLEDFNKRHEEIKNLQYYNLKISTSIPGKDITTFGLRNLSEQQQRLYYLSFYMKNDIRLIEGQDTLMPVLYHFERSYDLSDHRTFVLAFEAKQENKFRDKTFVLDSEILGTGPVKIKIEENDLKKIPKIKLL